VILIANSFKKQALILLLVFLITSCERGKQKENRSIEQIDIHLGNDVSGQMLSNIHLSEYDDDILVGFDPMYYQIIAFDSKEVKFKIPLHREGPNAIKGNDPRDFLLLAKDKLIVISKNRIYYINSNGEVTNSCLIEPNVDKGKGYDYKAVKLHLSYNATQNSIYLFADRGVVESKENSKVIIKFSLSSCKAKYLPVVTKAKLPDLHYIDKARPNIYFTDNKLYLGNRITSELVCYDEVEERVVWIKELNNPLPSKVPKFTGSKKNISDIFSYLVDQSYDEIYYDKINNVFIEKIYKKKDAKAKEWRLSAVIYDEDFNLLKEIEIPYNKLIRPIFIEYRNRIWLQHKNMEEDNIRLVSIY
jgi:hypothetical protein